MTLPRLARRYPALDRSRVDHTYGLDFNAVAEFEVVWGRGAPPVAVIRTSGLSLLGLVRTRARFGYVIPVPPLTGFAAQVRGLLDLIVSDADEANGWNVERNNIPISAVTRTSDFVVTIVLPPLPAYNITATETLVATAPGEIVTTLEPITGEPWLPVTP